MFLVFFLALLVTLNYYDLTFALVGKIAPKTDMKIRECISFITTYFLAFTVFLYFCVWLCAEKLLIHKFVDGVGGGVLGALCGIVCSGVLMVMWFHMPFAERNYPVDDASMFFPCHKFTARMVSFVNTKQRISGGRPFYGGRFLQDVRYGLPRIPSVGDGFYVSSIPSGLPTFIGLDRGSPSQFIKEIKGYLGKLGASIPPSEKERIGYCGPTPVFIDRSGKTALIAVVMDRIPSAVTPGPEAFIHDGEAAIATPSMGDQGFFIKVYRVEKEENIATLIALFQPKDEKLWHLVEDFLPTRECYHFETDRMVEDLMGQGVVYENAEQLARQVHYGGKAYFVGTGDTPKVIQMVAPGKWRISNPEEAFEAPGLPPGRRGRRGR